MKDFDGATIGLLMGILTTLIVGILAVGATSCYQGKLSVARDCEVAGTFRIEDRGYTCEPLKDIE